MAIDRGRLPYVSEATMCRYDPMWRQPMSEKQEPVDPDIISSFIALKRASRRARALSKATGTPFYIFRNGRVVDLNAPVKKRATPRRKPSL